MSAPVEWMTAAAWLERERDRQAAAEGESS
jgi:hypothetical protein